MKCKSSKFSLNRRVATFSDVQELRLQEDREELMEDDECDEDGNGFGNGVNGGSRGQSRGDGGRSDHGVAGRAPRYLEVEASDDLVDQCHPGDSIVVVGVICATNSALATGRSGKRATETSTFKLYLTAHSILNLTSSDDGGRGGSSGKHGLDDMDDSGRNKRPRSDDNASGSTSSTSVSCMHYTDQQLKQIATLAHADHLMYGLPTRMAFPFDLLVRSLCPYIIGNDLVKAGIILCLLGGTPPEVSALEERSGMSIRYNLHMLIVGDPGMGKISDAPLCKPGCG
jgi:DNA helicase MCM8